MAGARRTVSRVVAVILLVMEIVGICAGVALREFVVLAVPFAGGGLLLVVEALHLYFTGRIN